MSEQKIAPSKDRRFRHTPMTTVGNVRFWVDSNVGIIWIEETVHDDEPPGIIAIDVEEAAWLLAFLKKALS